MTAVEILGFCAALCTTGAFLPQAIKVIKTGDTKSLSLVMYIVFTFGVSLWLAYGLIAEDAAITFANAVTLVLAVVILVTKIKNEFYSRTEVK